MLPFLVIQIRENGVLWPVAAFFRPWNCRETGGSCIRLNIGGGYICFLFVGDCDDVIGW